MTKAPNRDTTRTPVVYVGEFEGMKTGEPPGVRVLNRWQVIPCQLAPVLKDTSALAVLEPLSLDFEALVSVSDPDPWEGLRRKCSWANSQRVEVEPDDPAREARQLLDALESSPHSLRATKTAHRAGLRTLVPRFEALWKERPRGAPPNVLEVGSGAQPEPSRSPALGFRLRPIQGPVLRRLP